MKDKFIELIKNEFRIEYLESQLVGLSENDLKEFLLFSMNEFEKIKVEGWLKIIEAYHDTGIVYLYESDFDKNYFGSFGFYVEDTDTTQTPLYMISETHLTDFINQCNRILKYRLVSQIKAPQPININESRTKKIISETISNIDKQGWEYAFVSEYDYNLFAELLTNFFEDKPYKLPETPIQLKRDCKTKLAKALGEIHKELSNEDKLSTDTNYFRIIRALNHFEKVKEGDLYKALTR
jgi:hypothetical protein